MKKIVNLLGTAMLTMALVLPVNAIAMDVYPGHSIKDIYVLSIEDGKAAIKTKGDEREYITIGDVIGKERMVVIKIDSLFIELRSEDGKTVTKMPVGGGFSY